MCLVNFIINKYHVEIYKHFKNTNTCLLNCSNVSCTTITNTNFLCFNASVFGTLVDDEFISFVNSCSHLNGVEWVNISNLNVGTLTNVRNLNGSVINAY